MPFQLQSKVSVMSPSTNDYASGLIYCCLNFAWLPVFPAPQLYLYLLSVPVCLAASSASLPARLDQPLASTVASFWGRERKASIGLWKQDQKKLLSHMSTLNLPYARRIFENSKSIRWHCGALLNGKTIHFWYWTISLIYLRGVAWK